MLIDDTHRGLRLRCEIYTFCNYFAAVSQNVFFITIYISLAFFRRVKEKIKIRILILEIKLQHFFAVVNLIALRICDSKGKIQFVLCLIREIGRIGIFLIQNILDSRILGGIDFKTAAVKQVGSLGFCVTLNIHKVINDLVCQFILKIGVNGIRIVGMFLLGSLNPGIYIIFKRLFVLFFRDIVLIKHMLQNFFPTFFVAVRVKDRVEFCRILGDTC